jgi:hypothetical protein
MKTLLSERTKGLSRTSRWRRGKPTCRLSGISHRSTLTAAEPGLREKSTPETWDSASPAENAGRTFAQLNDAAAFDSLTADKNAFFLRTRQSHERTRKA